MIQISENITLADNEVEITAVRSQGAGGQNVNKVSTAIHLRFDIKSSSLPEDCKSRLLSLSDYRITKFGILIIKAQKYRTQEQNREDAISRLKELINKALLPRKKRKPTKPSPDSKFKRLESKNKRSEIKAARSKIFRGDL